MTSKRRSEVAHICLCRLAWTCTQRWLSLRALTFRIRHFALPIPPSNLFTPVYDRSTGAVSRWSNIDGLDDRDMCELRQAYIAKAVIHRLANAFGATLFCASNRIIALGFTLYLLTFCYDLRMARSTTISYCRKGGGYERRWWTERSE